MSEDPKSWSYFLQPDKTIQDLRDAIEKYGFEEMFHDEISIIDALFKLLYNRHESISYDKIDLIFNHSPNLIKYFYKQNGEIKYIEFTINLSWLFICTPININNSIYIFFRIIQPMPIRLLKGTKILPRGGRMVRIKHGSSIIFKAFDMYVYSMIDLIKLIFYKDPVFTYSRYPSYELIIRNEIYKKSLLSQIVFQKLMKI